MTKEERIEKYVDETEEKLIKAKLEIEAEEYEQKQGYKGLLDALYEEGQNKGYECVRSYFTPYIVRAYLASAEPREKQIQIDAEQIRALQKQNGELTEQNTSLLTSVENLNKSVKELEEQIEKMKCCGNCTKGNCVNIGQRGKACAYWTSNKLRR